MTCTRLLACCLVSAVLACASAPAVTPQHLVEKWQRTARETDRALLDEDYETARSLSNRTIGEMMRRMGPGEAGARPLALVLMQRALAEAGLGDREAATWNWQVARQLDPDLESVDLDRFGPPGELLAAIPASGESGNDLRTVGLDRVTERPEARYRPAPDLPGGVRRADLEGPISLGGIIDEGGRVIRPLVLGDLRLPTVTYAALRALRRWRFRPARLDGEPVKVPYVVIFDFGHR